VVKWIPKRIRRDIYLDGIIPEHKTAFDKISRLEIIYKERALKEKGREWLIAPYEPDAWALKILMTSSR
jgi:hypothetical protein